MMPVLGQTTRTGTKVKLATPSARSTPSGSPSLASDPFDYHHENPRRSSRRPKPTLSTLPNSRPDEAQNVGAEAGPSAQPARPHAASEASSRSALGGYAASASSGPGSESGGDDEDEESTASEDGFEEGPARPALLSRPKGVWKGLTAFASPAATPDSATPTHELDDAFHSVGPSTGKGRQVLVEKRGYHPTPPAGPTSETEQLSSGENSRALFPSLVAAVATARASYANRSERPVRADDEGARLLGNDVARSKGRHTPLRTRDAKHRTGSPPFVDESALAAELINPTILPPSIDGPTASPALFSFLFPHGRKAPVAFRRALVPEVALIVSALALGIYRVHSVSPDRVLGDAERSLPIVQALLLLVVIPIVALFRRQRGSYLVPFTDERGYRDLTTDDDGLTVAAALPLTLCCGTVYDAGLAVLGRREVTGLAGLRGLAEVWDVKSVGADAAAQTGRSVLSFANRFLIAAAIPKAATGVAPGSATKLAGGTAAYAAEQARVLYGARIDLFCFTVLNAYGLLLDIVLARIALRISWLPRSNTKRFFGASAKCSVVASLFALAVHFNLLGPGLGRDDVSAIEAGASVYVTQWSIYVVTRLARRGFTLGEVSIFAATSMSLMLEIARLSLARWRFPALAASTSTPVIPALFRNASPVLALQHAMIPGIFTIGFLLAPLLLSSRALAQQPLRRRKGQPGTDVLRGKKEKERMRKGLALSVYAGAVAIIFSLLGGWAGWILGGGWAEPWSWAVRFACFGGDGVDGMTRDSARPRRWARLGLLIYWLACLSSAVGGWTTHIVRKRRLRAPPPTAGQNATGGGHHGAAANGKPSTAGTGMSAQPGDPSKAHVEEMREEKRMRAELNWRRKFFHGLAVLMFVPAIAIDPAFTSLAFSVAFSVFTFAEYARYFALFPIGAPIHVFFSEFVDNKDSGPVILSHFYLLTGCASGLWLEGRGIKQMTGVLALGVGDSMASIVGKRFGRIRWAASPKTVEGTVAFVLSMVLAAVLLRLVGAVDPFPVARFTLAVSLSALLEATTHQNDNLLIPLYNWALLSLLNV